MVRYGESYGRDNSKWVRNYFGSFGLVEAYLSLYLENVESIVRDLQGVSARSSLGWRDSWAKRVLASQDSHVL